MNLDKLRFRAEVSFLTRKFFSENKYVELDPPCFSRFVIPESSIEVFRTEKTKLQNKQYFLLPSPELYIKKLLADYHFSMFSLSHCFRAGENTGRIHSPEFTMLEYYTVDADYKASISITEKYFRYLVESLKDNPLLDKKTAKILSEDFLSMTVDEAFIKYGGFSLAKNKTKVELLEQVRRLDIAGTTKLEDYSYKDLYDLVLVSCVEPNLAQEKAIALMDYPAVSETLSKRKTNDENLEISERWEVYVNGIELANCYTELTEAKTVKSFLSGEKALRKKSGMLSVQEPDNFDKICERMPQCSGVALGFERLLMLLTGSKSIDGFIMQ